MTTVTRFDELLPFYVNGTLSAADRAWMEDWLRTTIRRTRPS